MTDYYVDGVDGADGNAGTSAGSGNAWKTIQKAADTVAAGDHVYVKGNGTYVENIVLSTSGSSAAPIIWEGYTTTIGDEGIATVSAASGYHLNLGAWSAQCFHNFRFTGGSTRGVFATFSDYCFWRNCEFDNNGGTGWYSDNTTTNNHVYLNCSFHNNSGRGVDNSGSGTLFINCVSYANTQHSFFSGSNSVYFGNLAYGIASANNGIMTSNSSVYINNTIDGESLAAYGIRTIATNQLSIGINNIVYDCVTGLYEQTDRNGLSYWAYNLLNSNITDETGITRVGYSANNQTGAPAFTDEAGDDYTLDSESPAVDNGLQPRES